MALVFCDGFDGYADGASDLSVKGWANGDVVDNTIIAAGGRWGGGCIQMLDDVEVSRTIAISGGTTIRLAFLIFLSSASTPAATYLFRMTGGTNQWEVRLTASGQIAVTDMNDGAPGGLVGTTTTSFDDDTWHDVEIRMVLGTNSVANGTIQIWVDDALEVNSAAAITNRSNVALSACTTFAMRSPMGSPALTDDLRIDDIIFWNDETGGMTGDLGQHRIYSLRPSAEGTTIAFTPSTGTDNSANVDDSPNDDGDATYNEASTSTNTDLYGYTDLPGTPGSIKTVVVNTVAKNADAGSISFQSIVRSGVTEGNSASTALSGSYVSYQHEFVNNPATASAWTPSEVNGMEAGLEVV